MSTLGQRIRASREARSMQQSELANLVNVKSDVISNWERDVNKPNADKLVLLCKALSVKLSYLLDYYGDETSGNNMPLTNDEESLVNSFRLLSSDGKSYILQTMDMALKSFKIIEIEEKGNPSEKSAIS